MINMKSLHIKYLLFFSDFNEIGIFSKDSGKSSYIKFYENRPSWSRVVPCRQTDRHDEANSHSSQFLERD